MKRKLTGLLAIVVTALILFSIWHFIPKRYTETVEGVYYQLGTEGIIEPIKIHLDGKWQNHINGKRTFEGTVEFEGDKVPQRPHDRTEWMVFHNGYNFTTIYSGFQIIAERIKPDFYTFGWVYTNDDFSEFTIQVNKDKWSRSNGFMITAPAKDRDEANKRSQEIFDQFLNNQ